MAASDAAGAELSKDSEMIKIGSRLWKIGDKVYSIGVEAVEKAKIMMVETFWSKLGGPPAPKETYWAEVVLDKLK